MPVVHRNVRYNCRVIVLDGKIILIRPKMVMADSGNYHESRWFAMWPRGRLEQHHLPKTIRTLTSQVTVPIGEAVIATNDTCIGFEICEEFWVSNCPHSTMALAGVEIFSNGSASHHEIGKFQRKLSLLRSAMGKAGGIYLFSNSVGCDGDRMFYDGGSLVVANDDLLAHGGLFTMQDVVVTTATVDLEDVRTFRGLMQSMGHQAQYVVDYPRIVVDFCISMDNDKNIPCTQPVKEFHLPSVEEEISLGPPLWLFDYLRKSGCNGFFLPISGGLDSASVALIVYRMSQLLAQEIDNTIVTDFLVSRLTLDLNNITAEIICERLLLTAYMGTENSSKESLERAHDLAFSIKCSFIKINFDTVVSAITSTLRLALNFIPKYRGEGGSIAEHLALQNVQARLRMVLGYAIAQLGPAALDRPGPLLVLATGNASETLRGYYTKYDCSSGDLNPIGSLDKPDLRAFCRHMALNNPKLKDAIEEILEATPTAELTPITEGPQLDEVEMGMTYEDLSLLAYLRNTKRYGPHSMCTKLFELRPKVPKEYSTDLVRKFFRYYTMNRHKATTLPPTYHARSTSPDDNRYDLRPLIYPSTWVQQCCLLKASPLDAPQ